MIGEYYDEGLSGSDADNRPGFQDAIALAKKKKAVLVVYSLSRFARSAKDALTYVEILNKAGAGLASINEHLDTSTSMGEFIFVIFSALAELERSSRRWATQSVLAFSLLAMSVAITVLPDPVGATRIGRLWRLRITAETASD